jgi:CheY-like chemotaxis protein
MTPANILCVEDHEMVRHTLKDLLEAEGWRVVAFEDGLSALAEIESRESYDLIILDNQLPDMEGLSLLRRVRTLEHRAATPVIVFSASDCERDARRAGANEFLKKPDASKR